MVKPKEDLRLVVGAIVHARAASVLNANINKVVHGVEASRKMLTGVVQEVVIKTAANNARNKYLRILFTYANGEHKKEETLKLSLVQAGKAPIPKDRYVADDVQHQHPPSVGLEKFKQTRIQPGDPIKLNQKAPSSSSTSEINKKMKMVAAQARGRLNKFQNHGPQPSAPPASIVSPVAKVPPPDNNGPPPPPQWLFPTQEAEVVTTFPDPLATKRKASSMMMTQDDDIEGGLIGTNNGSGVPNLSEYTRDMFDDDGFADPDLMMQNTSQQQNQKHLWTMMRNLQQEQAARRQHIGMKVSDPINLCGGNGTADDDSDGTISIADKEEVTDDSNKSSIPNDSLDAAAKRDHESRRIADAEACAAKKEGKQLPIKLKPILGILQLPEKHTAHGLTWYRDMPTKDINRYRGRHNWSMSTNAGSLMLTEGCNSRESHELWWYFMQCFPTEHLPMMVKLTNIQLAKQGHLQYHYPTSQNELIKFFGIILLIPRMPDIPRRDLWKKTSSTKYGIAPNFNRTGMIRH